MLLSSGVSSTSTVTTKSCSLECLECFSSSIKTALRGRDLGCPPLVAALSLCAAETLRPGNEIGGPQTGGPPQTGTSTNQRGNKGEGLALEFGVGTGGTLRLIAEKGRSFARVVGFDSFNGLPENWIPEWPQGSFTTHGVIPRIEGAEIVAGLFDKTLPSFLSSLPPQAPSASIKLVHIDCDLYSSTATVLTLLEPHLVASAPVLICFDELIGYPDADQHEMKALWELCCRSGMELEIIGSDQRPFEGDNLKFFDPNEACPHRVALRLHRQRPAM